MSPEDPVIRLTRLDGSEFYVNSDLIQTVQSTPDTHIVLMNGPSYVVREPDREVVARIIEFRRSIAGGPPVLKALEG
jgi:flagellar protein FlbD